MGYAQLAAGTMGAPRLASAAGVSPDSLYALHVAQQATKEPAQAGTPPEQLHTETLMPPSSGGTPVPVQLPTPNVVKKIVAPPTPTAPPTTPTLVKVPPAPPPTPVSVKLAPTSGCAASVKPGADYVCQNGTWVKIGEGPPPGPAVLSPPQPTQPTTPTLVKVSTPTTPTETPTQATPRTSTPTLVRTDTSGQLAPTVNVTVPAQTAAPASSSTAKTLAVGGGVGALLLVLLHHGVL